METVVVICLFKNFHMEQVLFTYIKNGKLKVLTQHDSKELHDNLVKNGWEHTATLNPVFFIENLFNNCNDKDRAGEIHNLGFK